MTRSIQTTKKSYHHGDLRKALLDDAARLLKEEGEAGLSMRNLAMRAGVSRTAAYHHFAGKHELLCGIAEEGFRRFREILDESELGVSRFVDLPLVERFVEDYIRFATDNSEYYDLMFGGHLWKNNQLTETLTEQAHRAFRGYVERIRDWQEQGVISEKLDPLRYSQVSWSTMHGMSRLLIDGIYVDQQSRKVMCQAAAEMLWRQLVAD